MEEKIPIRTLMKEVDKWLVSYIGWQVAAEKKGDMEFVRSMQSRINCLNIALDALIALMKIQNDSE